MSVEERSRRQLQEALMEAIGPDQTDTLLSYLPPTGWADVATTRDLQALAAELRGEMAELRGEMAGLRAELRGEMAELRAELRGETSELRGEIGHLRAELHRELRVQFYSLAGLMIGLLALVVAASASGLIG